MDKKDLSQLEEDYLYNEDWRCPICGSENLAVLKYRPNRLYQDMEVDMMCADCGVRWHESFTLAYICIESDTVKGLTE